MTKQEIKNKIEELENGLSELKEKLNKPESKVFKPKIGDIYYCINCNGEIIQLRWKNDSLDCKFYAIGNCFETVEKAGFEVEKLKVIAELKRFAEEHNEPMDWKNETQNKYFILFDYSVSIIHVDSWRTFKPNDIYFTSMEIAKQAIKEIGEDRIKKYYLGVEDEN